MSKSLADLIPEFIRSIEPYHPGKPIEEVERELKLRAAKLASNENPLGPSPQAVEAARRALAGSNRYPDGGSYYLREKLSVRFAVPSANIILGNGSTDLIDLAARALLRPGDEGLTAHGSFPMYYISIRAVGAKLVEVPLRSYRFDLDQLARAVTSRTRIIYIANPNNPTGTLFFADEFEHFLDRLPDHVVIVLDEAYYEYVEQRGYSRSIEAVHAGRNLLVLRTFSKVYGLAGLRVGYGIGPTEFVEAMNKVRLPFNVSCVAQAAAEGALDDQEHVRRSLESNRAGLAQLSAGMEKLGVRFVPSVANFVLVECDTDARPVSEALLKVGVIVRPMGWMGFPNAIRVTVGTREENDAFLAALPCALEQQDRAQAVPSPDSGAAR